MDIRAFCEKLHCYNGRDWGSIYGAAIPQRQVITNRSYRRRSYTYRETRLIDNSHSTHYKHHVPVKDLVYSRPTSRYHLTINSVTRRHKHAHPDPWILHQNPTPTTAPKNCQKRKCKVKAQVAKKRKYAGLCTYYTPAATIGKK